MWRDLAFRGFDTVYLVQPVSRDVVQRLQQGAIEVLQRERMDAGRRAEDSTLFLPESVPDLTMITAARAGRVPLRTVVAGDRVAVHLPHELADGVEGTRILAALLRAAAGESAASPEPGLRLPLVRAVAASGLQGLRTYLAGRAGRRSLPDPGAPVALGEGAFVRFTLDAPEVAALRRAKSSGGRATAMSRAASVSLAALSAVAPESTDARVVLPSDLRTLVGGRRVAGNFVSAEAYGTLRGTEWSPAAINRMLAIRRSTGAVALAAATLRRALRPRRTASSGRPTVSLSLMGAVDLPALEPARASSLACATIGTEAGTFVFVAQVGEALTVSLWDDTGVYDVDAFPEAFREEIRLRAR